MPGIGVVSNPNSRQNRKNPRRIPILGYIVGEMGANEATKDVDDINRVAVIFKQHDIDILCLNGGDGTNHCTLTAFIKAYKEKPLPLIAFLRGGTMNTISNSIRIKGNPASILHNIVEKYHYHEPFQLVERDTIKIGDDYGFIFGNGATYNYLDEYYSTGNPCPWVGFTTLVRCLTAVVTRNAMFKRLVKPFNAEVYVDGKKWPHSTYIAVFGATIEQLGLGFKPFHRCDEQSRTFHLLGVVGSPLQTLRHFPTMYKGKQVPRNVMIDAVAKKVKFRSREPINYMIDGDLHQGGNSLDLEVGPRLKLIVQ